jgi:signal transduction histidine kinase
VGIIVVAAIELIASGISATILSWNRRLNQLVEKRTAELTSRTTELEKANQDFDAANEELRNLDRMKTEFVNIAAHELRNPLQLIITYSELARQGAISKDQALDVIDGRVQRLKQLASHVLTISRMESGSYTMQIDRFSLNDFIDRTVVIARTWIAPDSADRLSIRKDVDRDVIVNGDKIRLGQVLENIIGNALKFSSEGEIVISTRIIAETNTAQIDISDTGTGISEDILPNLFGKFVTSNNGIGIENKQGAGLWLYISKKIVEAHGGRIWAENNKSAGKPGATFTFTLPIAQEQEMQ